MAIWQFRLDLIPTSALRAKFGTAPTTVPHELAEDFAWWSDAQPPAGLEASIDVILPRANSWSTEMLIWGDERGDTASVCYNSNRKIEWIGFRVDVRRLSPTFVTSICRLAKELECMLLTGQYHLIAPDDQAVLAAINQSTAKNYLDAPVSTLLSLKPKEGGKEGH
jgi:hypothetical protein